MIFSIKQRIKKIVKTRILPFFDFLEYKPQYSALSYSQEGEDMILRRIFEKKKKGFYVDVGAHHPRRFSNTFYFYQKGWRGINIDAMPGSMKLFEQLRPKDINLELAISDTKATLLYYMFNEPALNTFSAEDAKSIGEESGIYTIVAQKEIETCPLVSVLDAYLPPDYSIDFLSIDVEGFDMNVARSNDWDKYRPKIVLLEERHQGNMVDVLHSDLYNFMISVDYQLIGKTFNTLFFKTNT